MELSFTFTKLDEASFMRDSLVQMIKRGVRYAISTSHTRVPGEYIVSCDVDENLVEEVQQLAEKYNGTPLDPEHREARTELYEGIKDGYVMELKILLRDKGYYESLTFDSYFGTDLTLALKAFQQDHGLPPTGITSPDTWNNLRGI